MEATNAAGGSPLDAPVGRLVPERASACGLTECAGKPMCPRCVRWKARDDGMPGDPDERHLRRLLAVRVAMPHTYYDDGEAQGQEHGISIDFMREPVADIDAKLRALNVARIECANPLLTPDQCDGLRMVLAHYAGDPRVMPLAALLDAARRKTPNVGAKLETTAAPK